MRIHAALPIVLFAASALGASAPSSDGTGPKTSFESAPIPSTSSSPPTAAEWEEATPIALKWSFGCRVRMAREWLRVWCPGPPVRLAVIDGDRDDIELSTAVVPDATSATTRTTGAMVAFPLRRGMRRAVQLWSTVEDNLERGDVRLISAYWLDDEARPVVTIQ